MQHSHYRPPANHDTTIALIGLIILILWMSMYLSSCVSFDRSSGPARKWTPATYVYDPTTDGRCRLTDHVSKHTIDCSVPDMYEMACTTLTEIKNLEQNVLPACRSWK